MVLLDNSSIMATIDQTREGRPPLPEPEEYMCL
ncbi:hypothetical protein DOY81_009710, partial [Sarcophaga bullata]